MKKPSKIKTVLSTVAAALVMTAVSSHLSAQTLVDYNPDDDSGLNGNNYNGQTPVVPFTPSNVSPLITATNFVRGPGTANYDNAGGGTDFFGAFITGNNDAALSDAVSNGIYETFSITAGAKGALITGLSLKNDFYYQSSNDYTIEDTAHGFGTSAANILAQYDNPGVRYSPGSVVTFATPTILLPGATDTFRLYVDGLGTYIDFGIGSGGHTTDTAPFEVLGRAIPEPSTYAMLGLGLAFLLMAMRHRRSSAV